jgi:hypothetical protein
VLTSAHSALAHRLEIILISFPSPAALPAEDAKEERVRASLLGKSPRASELLWIRAPDEQGLRCTTFDSATIVTLDNFSGGIAIVSPLHGEG